jgi:3-phosphoshikimate 1-carboxyvinyltransferase
MKTIEIQPCSQISGSITIPGDKSISHRALMFSSLANGTSTINNLLEGHDCIATLQVMRSLGVHISLKNGQWIINGRGKSGLCEPTSILDCKNSGTTIRLMTGLLSAMPFLAVLDGTEQIKTRPMGRVIKPLLEMKATIFGRLNNSMAPIVTTPAQLTGIAHTLQVKSAQVKSALILAALFAQGKTTIFNTKATRDHTERLLSFMGADIETSEDSVVVNPLQNELTPISIDICGDISSAAFLIAAGALLATNGLTVKNVGINPTRTGIVDALKMMGAKIGLTNQRSIANEPVADIFVQKSDLKAATFAGDHIVRMIDEIPVLALLATQSEGTTIIKDASELKVKESNRIKRTVESLKALSANIEETDDGMIIHGPIKLLGGEVSSFLDHRMALFLSIAGLISKNPVTLRNAEVTDDSFPHFYETLTTLGALVKEV